MRILALDLSSKLTGWASNMESGVESGVADFRDRRNPRARADAMTFARIRRWLEAQVRLFQPEAVVWERPNQRGGRTTEVLMGITTRAEEVCGLAGIPHRDVPLTTLKKWATGKGNASKEEMIAEAERRFDRKVASDDEADALLLLALALEEYGTETVGTRAPGGK